MKCPICYNHTNTFIDEKQSTEYHKCAKCQYIFKSHIHHSDLIEQKKRYDLHENNPLDLGYRAYFQRFLDFILPHVSPHSDLALDFGSGASDLLSSMLIDAGYDSMRYDPIYHPDNTYRDNKFELIVSTEVFEHLDKPFEVFEQLADILNHGGYLALQTQFYPHDQYEFLKWYYRLDPTHIGFFIPDTFHYMARVVGLEYVADDGINKVIFRK